MDNWLTLTINVGAIITVLLGMWKYWILSKGAIHLRQVYWLTIAAGVVNFITNMVLVMHDPGVWAFLSFQVVIVWSIIMSIKGLNVYNNVRKGENNDVGTTSQGPEGT